MLAVWAGMMSDREHRPGSSALGAEGTKLDFRHTGNPQSDSHFNLTLSKGIFGMLEKSSTEPMMNLMVIATVVSRPIMDLSRSSGRYRLAIFS